MDVAVQVTILGEKPVSFEAVLLFIESRFLSVRLALAPELHAALKVETAEQLWMGEVTEIRPDGSAWIAVLRIRHVLLDTPDLTRLAERFLGNVAAFEMQARITR